MNNRIKFIKIGSIVVLLIIGSIGIYKLNSFLMRERLLFYSKGSTKKAFLNATWKMSEKEVERAIGCKLTKEISFTFLESDLNKLLDIDRITSKKSCRINIWGENRDVSYDFFDDQLFRVRIYDDIFNKIEIDSLIVTSLEQKYGKFERDKKNEYTGKFESDDVDVYYTQFEHDNKENKKVMRFSIVITYKPMLNEIIRISKQDQKNIF